MAESVWGDRLRRVGLILRAPWLFLTAQSYRQAVFKGMFRGEILVRSGVRRLIAPSGEGSKTLRLVLRQGAPAVTLVTSTIAFDGPETAESRRTCSLLAALAKMDLDIRLIAVEDSTFPHEARVRRWLMDQGVIDPSVQGRLEVLDGTGPFVPVTAEDVFIVAGEEAQANLLRERFAQRAPAPDIHVMSGDIAETALTGRVSRLKRKGPPTFPERSRLGLGYTVLKPLAATHKPARTCLFVHFDPDGRMDPHVLRYLSALKACGLDIVLISAANLRPEAFAAAQPLTVAAIARQNKGLDFSGWALALELFPSLLQSQSLLIANDSVYGPVGDLKAFLERVAAQPLDICGALESHDIERHFQSWFVRFDQRAVRSDTFAAFWSGVLPLDDKRAVIHQYEVPIWRVFEAAGFRVGAAVTWNTRGSHDNPAMDGWRALLNLGLPFVKVQLLRDNPSLSTSLDGWAAELKARGYPADLVVDHLYRVRGPEAAAFKDE
jgi:hypothetical protein